MRDKEELENLYRNYEAEMQPDLETEEYSRLRRQIIEETDELKKELTEEHVKKLEHIFETINERDAEEMKEVFIYGFALATRLFTAGLKANTEGVNDEK